MRALVIAASIIAPAAAHADRFDQPRLEVGTGALMGEFLGPTRNGAVPRVLVAYDSGSLRIAGEYGFIDFQSADQRDASLHRLAVTARFTAATFATHELRTGWYIEAGIGRELASWHAGGSSTRPDVTVGVGWRFTGGLRSGRNVGMSWGLHVLAAPAWDRGDAARCIGCPTPGRDVAVSLAWEVGLQ